MSYFKDRGSTYYGIPAGSSGRHDFSFPEVMAVPAPEPPRRRSRACQRRKGARRPPATMAARSASPGRPSAAPPSSRSGATRRPGRRVGPRHLLARSRHDLRLRPGGPAHSHRLGAGHLDPRANWTPTGIGTDDRRGGAPGIDPDAVMEGQMLRVASARRSAPWSSGWPPSDCSF